ncbi:MAG: GNAT family N-acetyltransferase [Acidobacteriota bacterium]
MIRRATPADLPNLLPLLDRYYTEWQVQVRDTPAQTLTYLNHPTLGFLVAEEDNALAACVLLRDLSSIPQATECKRLYVLPTHRGAGLANRLMDAAEAQARAAHLTFLYLDTGNDFAAAIAFYRRRGYEEIPRFNDNPQAAFFFRKAL